MRFIALLILLLPLHLRLLAAPVRSSLTGHVTDTKGQPIPGVIIELPDLHTGAATDANGEYRILNLPSGRFLVIVKMLGFGTLSQSITLNGETTKDFTLSEAVLEQHEVIVTGTSAATEQRRSTTPIQAISMRQMRENANTNVIDAITRLPGVAQLSTGPAISKPIIRGLGYNRIITLNDGIRQEGQQWGDEHGIEIDDNNVSRVEVLKGPASLSYGSDAIAGVVNILSEDPAPVGKIRGTLGGGYHSNNGMGNIYARLAGNNGTFHWSGYYSAKQAHDYKNVYDGFVYNSRFRNLNYGATVGIRRTWGSSSLAFTSFNQQLGIAEGDRDSATGLFIKPVNDNGTLAEVITTDSDNYSYKPGIPKQKIEHKKLAWVNNLYLRNGGRAGFTLGYQQNDRKEFDDVLMPDVSELHLLLSTFTYSAQYLFPVRAGWQLSTGINGMAQRNENKGNEFLIPDYKLFDIGAYLIARHEWRKWTIAGGLRIDNRMLNTEALYVDSLGANVPEPIPGSYVRFNTIDKTFTSPSGSIGLSYAANANTTFKANIASGYRAPNIAELSANGVHEGSIRYEYGNSSLGAENSFQLDLGGDWHSEHLSFNAAVFYNYIRNFVFIRKLPGLNAADSIPALNNDEGFPAFVYDQTEAKLFGGELYSDFHPHPFDWLHLENTISYVQGRTANPSDSTKYLPNIPAGRWLVALRAQTNSLSRFISNAYAKVELDNYLAQNNVFSAYGTEVSSPGYSLLNAGIGCDLQRKQRTLASITITGQNLSDIGYQNHLSRLRFGPKNYATDRKGIFGLGRNISLQITVPLSLK